MKNLAKSLIIGAVLLFSNASIADEYCGMKGTTANVEVSFITCENQPRAKFMGEMNYKTIINNFIFDGDPIQQEFEKRMGHDPEFKARLERNYEKSLIISNGVFWILVAIVPLLLASNLLKFIFQKALPDSDEFDGERYNFPLDYTLKSVGFLTAFFPVGGFPLIGWFVVILISLSIKIEDGTGRFLIYLTENFKSYNVEQVENGQSSLVETTKNKVKVNFEKSQSISIILDIYDKIYAPMVQTDKAYKSIDKKPLVPDLENFVHIKDTKLDFYRLKENSQIVEFTQGHLITPIPDFNWLSTGIRKELDLSVCNNTDIGQLEGILTKLRTEIKTIAEIPHSNSISADNIIDTCFLISAAKIRQQFYKDIFTNGTLTKIHAERLAEACFDDYKEVERSKRYYKTYIDENAEFNILTDDGAPYCIHHNGMEYEVLGLGSDATNIKASTSDRSIQDEFHKNELIYFNEAVEQLHNLLTQLAEIRVSVGITEEDLQLKREAATNGLSFITNSSYLVWDAKREKAALRAFSLNTGDKVISYGSENNYINYEFLNRGGKKAFAESLLNFSIYKERLRREVLDGVEINNKSSISNLTQAVENGSGFMESNNKALDFLTSPITTFYSQFGMDDKCLNDFTKCEDLKGSTQEVLVNLGQNLMDTSIQYMTYSFGLLLGQKALDRVSQSLDKEKGSKISKNNKSAKYSKTFVNKISAISGVLGGIAGIISVICLVAGVFLAKVLPFIVNTPFFMAYLLFSLLFIMTAILAALFIIWLFIPNDLNNLQGLWKRSVSLMVITLFTIPIILLIKFISILMIDISLYLLVVISSTIPDSGVISTIIKLAAIIVLIIPVITITIKLCLSTLNMFFNMLGSSMYFESQIIQSMGVVSEALMKWIPIYSIVMGYMANRANNSLMRLVKSNTKKGD